MKHFLDLGTHYFYGSAYKNGLLSFEERGFFGNSPPHDWCVQTFEPSSKAYKANTAHIDAIASRFTEFEAHHAAVAAFDGTITFKWCPQNEAGSNCLNTNVVEVGEVGAEEYEVQAIDIYRLVSEIVDADGEAEITIKCDIEGSEFTVLPRLLELENIGRWVKTIFTEWHDRFWMGKENYSEIMKTKAIIIEKCASNGVVLGDWL